MNHQHPGTNTGSRARNKVLRFAGDIFQHQSARSDNVPFYTKSNSTVAWKNNPGADVRAQVSA